MQLWISTISVKASSSVNKREQSFTSFSQGSLHSVGGGLICRGRECVLRTLNTWRTAADFQRLEREDLGGSYTKVIILIPFVQWFLP